MLKEVYLYEHVDGHLVRVTPTARETLFGRKMAATLALLAREWRKGRRVVSHVGTIGEIRYTQRMKGRKHYLYIEMLGGELGYKEIRDWLVLGVQYATGHYPMLIIDMERKRVEITLPGWVSFESLVG